MSKELAFSVTKEDFVMETFRCGGKGGQNQNKRDSGVRLRHTASGAVAESREERSQLQNRQNCLKKIAKDPRFLAWASMVAGVTPSKRQIEEAVESSMTEKNLKVEVKREGKWVETDAAG